MTKLQRRPGFLQGFGSIFGAFRFLGREPASWPIALVPTLIFAVVAILGTIAGVTWVTPATVDLLGLQAPEGFFATAGAWLLKGVMALLSAVVGFFAAFLITPPLSAPALEHLIAQQETELGVPPRGKMSFVSEVWCGLRAQFFGLAFATPVLIGLWLLGTLFPPLTLVTTPLKILVVSLGLAWNLFDYPLTLRGVGSGDRIGFILENFGAVLGFGLAFAALFWVPCFGILMLPVGAVAATRLVWQVVATSERDVPELPQPKPPELNAMLDVGAERSRQR